MKSATSGVPSHRTRLPHVPVNQVYIKLLGRMSILRHSVWSAAAGIVVTGSRFAVAAILARRLSQGAFWQYAYAQWLVDISFLFCSLGVTAPSRASPRSTVMPRFCCRVYFAVVATGDWSLSSNGLAVLCGAWRPDLRRSLTTRLRYSCGR